MRPDTERRIYLAFGLSFVSLGIAYFKLSFPEAGVLFIDILSIISALITILVFFRLR